MTRLDAYLIAAIALGFTGYALAGFLCALVSAALMIERLFWKPKTP